MQRQVLGKSIGKLLDSAKPLVKPANQTDNKIDPDKLSSPGLKVLVGSPGAPSFNPKNGMCVDNDIKQESKKGSQSESQSKIPLWFLIIADVVLVGMPFVLILGKTSKITKLEIGISAAAIIIGGILTCWGFVLRRNKN
ncbi:MAG TPA: hypothetical protein PLW02_01505 [Verrucomicrobiota bacterium]|nr:hypothetical protein [Verrucomicrobiota bacterium]